jgi:hypothetical protein
MPAQPGKLRVTILNDLTDIAPQGYINGPHAVNLEAVETSLVFPGFCQRPGRLLPNFVREGPLARAAPSPRLEYSTEDYCFPHVGRHWAGGFPLFPPKTTFRGIENPVGRHVPAVAEPLPGS